MSDDDNDRTSYYPRWISDDTRHNGTNNELWKNTVESNLRHFGPNGKSLRDGINRIKNRPHKSDLIDPSDPNSNYKYSHLIIATPPNGVPPRHLLNLPTNTFVIQNRPGATITITDTNNLVIILTISDDLDSEGANNLMNDIRSFEKYLEKYLKVSGKLITFLLSGITTEIQSALELVPVYKHALIESLSFEFYAAIQAKYGHTTNGRMIAHRTLLGLQLKQTGLHEDFCHAILKLEKTLQADLGGNSLLVPIAPDVGFRGYISIRNLVTIIYQMGLSPNDFAQRLEVFYSTNPNGIIVGTLEDNMTANSLYINSKKSSTVGSTSEHTSSLLTGTQNPWSNNNNIKPPANNPRPSTNNRNNTTANLTAPPPPPGAPPSKTSVYTHPTFLNGGKNTKCTVCGASFPTKANKNDPTHYHKQCNACFTKRQSDLAALTQVQPPPANTKVGTLPPPTDPKSAAAANRILLSFFKQLDEDYEPTSRGLFTPALLATMSSDDELPPHVILTTPDVDYNLFDLFNPTNTPSATLYTSNTNTNCTPVTSDTTQLWYTNPIDSSDAFKPLRICSLVHLHQLDKYTAFQFYASCLPPGLPRPHIKPSNITLLPRVNTVNQEFRFHETTGHIQNKRFRRPSPTSHREQRNLHRSSKRTHTSFAQLHRRSQPSHHEFFAQLPRLPRPSHHKRESDYNSEAKARLDAWNALQTDLVRYVPPGDYDDYYEDHYEQVLSDRRHNGHYANRDNPMPFKLFCDKYHKNLRRSKRHCQTRNRTRTRQSNNYSHSFQTSSNSDDHDISLGPQPFGYWDSGCTYSITPLLEIATNPMPITPFSLGTSQKNFKGLNLSHVGAISGVSSPANRIYYCKEATCTLFSMGWFLEHDHQFTFPRIAGRIHQLVHDPTGNLISDTVLGKNFLFKLPSHFLHPNTAINHGVCHFNGGFAAAIHFDASDEFQFTKPQQLNIKLVKTIHLKYGHLPEVPLTSAIENHCFSHLDLTRQDVINFFMTKKCTCISSRMHMPSNPPSTNPIAQTIGCCVTVDINTLPALSYGGNTQEITSYDELSTKGHIVGMKNKKTKVVATTLLTIKSFYISRQHSLDLFLSDSEGNFESARLLILPSGTLLQHTPPLEHCKRNERFQQRINELSTATLELLPYHLPSKYDIHLKQHSIHLHNSVPNSITLTRSPDQIFDSCSRSLNPNFPFLPFGAVCSVKSNPLTMLRRATLYNTDLKYISPSEVGVNLGWDDAHPYCHAFLLANTVIIFRKIFTPLDDSVIPFGWLPKLPDYKLPNLPVIPPAHTLDHNSTDSNTSPVLSTPSPPPSTNIQLPKVTLPLPLVTQPDPHPPQLPPTPTTSPLPSDNNCPLFSDSTWTTVLPKSKKITFQSLPTPPISDRTPPISDRTRNRSIRRGEHPLTKALLSTEDSTLINDSDFFLIPPLIKKEELTYKQAMLHPAAAKCTIALAIELGGLIDTLNALGPLPTAFADIPSNAAIIPNKVFFKYKPSLPHEWKCRFVLGGDRQPADTYGETFAGMADLCLSLLIIALCQAHSILNQYTLHVAGFDITMAFPKVAATPENCPRPMYTRISDQLDHPLAGQYMAINSLIYGAKQANHGFDQEEIQLVLSIGFTQIDGDSHVFIKRDPTDTNSYCILSLHVDDGRSIYSDSGHKFYSELIVAHELRWGKMTIHNPLVDYLGQQYSYNSNGSITITMEKYILKALVKAGLSDDTPGADSPCTDDLFEPTTDPTPVSIKQYQSVVGLLIYLLPIRHDIRLPVGHLARANLQPTRGDFIKVIRVLRYLKTTADLGLTFHSTNGFQLSFSADASHACHPNGRSQHAYGTNCGNNSAPATTTYSSMNTACVTTSAQESEYVVLSLAAKKFIHQCNVADQLGFRQHYPLAFYSDNAPALQLTTSIDVTKKSRHVNNMFHFIRELVKQFLLHGVHVDNIHNHINLLTKPLHGAQFRFERDNLMNVAARISTAPTAQLACQLLAAYCAACEDCYDSN